jgi:hypothetical protein
VLPHAGRTEAARAAADIDLAGHAAADPRAIVSTADGFDDPDEFVAGNPVEASVSFEQLQIRAADARHSYADQTFAVMPGNWLVAKRECASIFYEQCPHGLLRWFIEGWSRRKINRDSLRVERRDFRACEKNDLRGFHLQVEGE